VVDTIIVIAALLAAALGLVVLRGVRILGRRLDALQTALDEQRAAAAAATSDLGQEVARITAQVDRLADAAGLPELDAPPPRVSRVPQVLRTRPVVKAMAFGTGTAHAARRLRSGNGNGKGH
jgi:hypothetical protein